MKSSKRVSMVGLPRKKRYQPPKLVIYGDLRHLTKVKGGASADGAGKPKTKIGGTNA